MLLFLLFFGTLPALRDPFHWDYETSNTPKSAPAHIKPAPQKYLPQCPANQASPLFIKDKNQAIRKITFDNDKDKNETCIETINPST